jgi:hypothetical protein
MAELGDKDSQKPRNEKRKDVVFVTKPKKKRA